MNCTQNTFGASRIDAQNMIFASVRLAVTINRVQVPRGNLYTFKLILKLSTTN